MNSKYIDFVPSRGGSSMKTTKSSTIIMPSRTGNAARANRNGAKLAQSVRSKSIEKEINSSTTVKRSTMMQSRKAETVVGLRRVETPVHTRKMEASIQSKKIQAPVQLHRVSGNGQVAERRMGTISSVNSVNNKVSTRGSLVGSQRVMPIEQKNAGKVRLGVIEELPTGFMTSDVPKRPLSAAKKNDQEDLSKIKARKLRGERKLIGKQAPKSVVKEAPGNRQEEKKSKYVLPKSPFINQTKVEKRPLSKNVYQQRAAEAKSEKLSGPVTIIEKPEKDSRISMVVIIILTIIIGAAAGTVAFLLLPR